MPHAALRSNEALKSRRARRSERRGRILFFSARGADTQACHGPLERLLEGLPPRTEGTGVAWHCLTARMRATPTSNEARRSSRPQQIAPDAAAAQRRRPPHLVTTVSRASKVALRVLRRSYGAEQPRKRRDLHSEAVR